MSGENSGNFIEKEQEQVAAFRLVGPIWCGVGPVNLGRGKFK